MTHSKPILLWSALSALVILGVLPMAAGDALPLIGDIANGSRLFRMHCSVCHGFDGSGAGPGKKTLKIAPADHRDGSLMNARDNRMLFDRIQNGCLRSGCSKAMPGFRSVLNSLDTWDLVSYLRSLHFPLTFFFPRIDQYLVKQYHIGQLGNDQFKSGQLERLKKAIGKVAPEDLKQTVFTLYRASPRRTSPELVPQQPRRLAELQKENKVGYVFFLELIGPRNRRVPIGMAFDRNYTIVKLVATMADPAQAGEYNQRFEKYIGLGKRGNPADFDISKDKVGKIFDKALARVYALGVEGANAFELEERERSWADDTF